MSSRVKSVYEMFERMYGMTLVEFKTANGWTTADLFTSKEWERAKLGFAREQKSGAAPQFTTVNEAFRFLFRSNMNVFAKKRGMGFKEMMSSSEREMAKDLFHAEIRGDAWPRSVVSHMSRERRGIESS